MSTPQVPEEPDRPDGGSILVLTLGYTVLLLSLVLVVVDVSAVFLARRNLAGACDAASLAAAQSVDTDRVYHEGVSGAALPLADVRAAVARFGTDGAPGTSLTADVRNGDTVVVNGRRTVTVPVVSWLGLGAVTLTARAEASARQLGTAP